MAWLELQDAEEELARRVPDVDHDGALSKHDQMAEQLRARADEIDSRAVEAVNELGPSPAAIVASMHSGRLRAQADDHEAQAAMLLKERLGPAVQQVQHLRGDWMDAQREFMDAHAEFLAEAAQLEGLV